MTDRKPFEPADGVEARWRKLYELVLARPSGEQITYGEVQDLLDCDRQAAIGAMHEARERLLEDGHIAVKTIDLYGWVRMTAAEQITWAEDRRRRAAKQVERGVTTYVAVQNHRDELSAFDRERADRGQASLVRHLDLVNRPKRSLAKLAQLAKQANKQGEIAS